PNPFNPETHIKFNIPVESKVSIKIYNILGQEIIELTSGNRIPGFYEIVWEGKNKNHQSVASGMYIYQIYAQSVDGTQRFVQSKKMLLLH
ncbi:MAG: T9SS type A sorting domain-containing protein, partial [bacterium]